MVQFPTLEIYVASGNIMEEIRKEWITKGKEKVKGYADVNPGHRTNFSERSQAKMGEFLKSSEKLPNKNEAEESNIYIFNAPTMVYLTLNKGHMPYSVLDLGGLEMSIMLAAKDHGVIQFQLILLLCIQIF